MRGFGAIVILMMLASSVLAQASIYTPTHGPTCRDAGSRSALNIWRCPGPAGYEIELADEGNIVSLAIGSAKNKGKLGPPVSWRGAGPVFGDKIEWRFVNDKPVAAILRIWRSWTDREGNDRTAQELWAMRLSPIGACRVEAIDVHQASANSMAQQLADAGTCAEPQ